MTNTGFKAMNIEEQDLVTGGSFAEDYEAVKQAMNSGAPATFIAETVADIKDNAERLGSATVTLGKQIYNKFKSWFN